jgi:hypothetical protein
MHCLYDALAGWPRYPLSVEIAGRIRRREIDSIGLPLDIHIFTSGFDLAGVSIIFTFSHRSDLLAVL